MRTPSVTDKATDSEPPLWSIGIAAVIILITPLVLYSFAPTGPIREGDTVFSDGQQRVRFSNSVSSQSSHADETCLLDPNSPLIVLENSTGEPGGFITAEVQGSPSTEWPFCLVHTEVTLKLHQVFQKPAALGVVRDALTRWFGR